MAELLTQPERDRIREAVAAAESQTSGEIFVVVAHASDDYRFIPILWATLAALLVPLPLIFLTALPASLIYAIQLAVFVVLAIILSLTSIKPYVVPVHVKDARAHALAMTQFLAHGLHTTEARTGALIFVSIFERHAEIVADTGIAARVDQATWDTVMASLLDEIRAGRLTDGLVTAVAATGALLSRHFPLGTADRDELPNTVVVL